MNFKKFAPLAKVDLARGTITGVATSGLEVDRASERLDYQASVPAFKKWSDSVRSATNGKSLGNLREMHQPIAAGYITALNFDDANQRISISGKVVDQNTLRKCELAVLNSLSIGGSYATRRRDPLNAGAVLYTVGAVHEISLVDYPALDSAQFELTKRDGSREMCKVQARQSESGQWAQPSDSKTHRELVRRGFQFLSRTGDASHYVHAATGHLVSVRGGGWEGGHWESQLPGKAPHQGVGHVELSRRLDAIQHQEAEAQRLGKFRAAYTGSEPITKNLGGVRGLLQEVIALNKRSSAVTIALVPWR